ncbi:uncharacterized protein K452DRAFT_360827 [Aplosporella prunicola CBS 121167]|uniref:Uncharacterized protein n=1 Tax=Aplosporella prunicola CBS 121167 TaxID=1176127 RepID=A0A6A6B876_9PEZI|nr:uncharacterized protein K452DRAFT_360827 [Aplosporella prunicola CBS 121167]KAF2139107.1 hypothetical protein K452DRAFT_360827 [Aplosporella prunicola CBS 121167]
MSGPDACVRDTQNSPPASRQSSPEILAINAPSAVRQTREKLQGPGTPRQETPPMGEVPAHDELSASSSALSQMWCRRLKCLLNRAKEELNQESNRQLREGETEEDRFKVVVETLHNIEKISGLFVTQLGIADPLDESRQLAGESASNATEKPEEDRPGLPFERFMARNPTNDTSPEDGHL